MFAYTARSAGCEIFNFKVRGVEPLPRLLVNAFDIFKVVVW